MTCFIYPTKDSQENKILLMFRGEEKFLSNFFPCSVRLPAETAVTNGTHIHLPSMEYSCVEKAYVAWKTLDGNTRSIVQGLTPSDAKEFSHDPAFLLRPDYSDQGRIQTMFALAKQKFGERNPDLRQKLLDTNDASIVEGNTWGDTFFGFDLTQGQGQNWLGKILMTVRDDLREEQGLCRVKDLPEKPLLRLFAVGLTFKE